MKTLPQLQAENLPHATCENIGLVAKPKGDSNESWQVTAKFVVEADAYFADFTPGPKCPKCGTTLNGMFGSFTWGIANGEGYCVHCKYPARAYHRSEPFEMLTLVLPYHPSVLQPAEEMNK